jgi:transcription initiation factor TFIIB
MTEISALWAEFDLLRLKDQSAAITKKEPKRHEFLCKYCDGVQTFNGDGLPTCTNCGVVEDYIDDGAEWVSNVDDTGRVSDPARCGAPKDLELFSEQWGSSTMMKPTGRSTWAQKRMARIGFHMSMNHRDRALYHAYKDIDAAAKDALSLPDNVVRQAKIFYRKFNESKLTRGAVRNGIKANCVMYACKLSNIPRTTKEIADAYGIPTRDISRTHELFKQQFTEEKAQPETSAITKPIDVVNRLMNNFRVGGTETRKTIMKCRKLCEKLENCVELMGKTPNSIASVVILLILKPTKKEVCQNCGISMPTLNKIESVVKNYLEENSILIE